MSQNRSNAVMATRIEPADSLDNFPTPPWAARALCEWMTPLLTSRATCWEPAAGERHMSRVLMEYFSTVWATDIADYGCIGVQDFLDPSAARYCGAGVFPDWIITNPPFRLAEDFIKTALGIATHGVAMFARTSILEGGARWREIYDPTPPTDVLIFSERVPIFKGKLDRKGSTATSYCWLIWNGRGRNTQISWLPPGTRKRLERDGDYA